MYKGLILWKLKLRLMGAGAGAEEGFPPLSLANVLEEGCPRPSLRRTTTKQYNFRSTESLSRHIFTHNLFTDSATFNRQLLSWWYGKRKFFTMLWSNVNRFFTTAGRERGDVQMVDWGDLPLELWGEIGKRLSSRLDILRFRSACKKWRSSLPSPTRFPLRVPQPPNFDRKYKLAQEPPSKIRPPYVITEYNVYRCEGVRGMLAFGGVDQARRFYIRHIRRDRFGSRLREVEFDSDRPSVSFMTSRANPYYRMTCVRTAYRLRLDFPLNSRVVPAGWSFSGFQWAKKTVIISSNAEEGVNLSYARASDLTVVALLIVGSLKGRLAFLKLGGSSQDWAWDTDSCRQVWKDIGTYGGRLCTLDPSGRVFLMDYNSLKMTRVSPPLYRKVRAAFATLKV